MTLQKIISINKPDFYISKALKNSKKGRKVKSQDKKKRQQLEKLQRIRLYKDILCDDLKKIIEGFPSFADLNPFYKDLIDSQLGTTKLKQELSNLKWVQKKITHLHKDYSNRIKQSKGKIIAKYEKEFFGRTSSVFKKSAKSFKFLEHSRRTLQDFPVIKTNMNTICIAGFPNVGKSTLLNKLTGSAVEIKPYPFTTKQILVGYIEKKLQLVDTPGSLNRYEKMNKIEKQAYLAIKYLAAKIIYIFDLTETCGYEIEKQVDLFKKIKNEFQDKEIIIFFSKTDLLKKEQIELFSAYLKDHKLFYDAIILKEYITS